MAGGPDTLTVRTNDPIPMDIFYFLFAYSAFRPICHASSPTLSDPVHDFPRQLAVSIAAADPDA